MSTNVPEGWICLAEEETLQCVLQVNRSEEQYLKLSPTCVISPSLWVKCPGTAWQDLPSWLSEVQQGIATQQQPWSWSTTTQTPSGIWVPPAVTMISIAGRCWEIKPWYRWHKCNRFVPHWWPCLNEGVCTSPFLFSTAPKKRAECRNSTVGVYCRVFVLYICFR